jgi:hypothetical protein
VLLLADELEPRAELPLLLEDAGHRVELVVRAEDAMVRAKVASYDAFIVVARHCDSSLARAWPFKHPDTPLVLLDPPHHARAAPCFQNVPCLAWPADRDQLAAALEGRASAGPSTRSSQTSQRIRRLLVVLGKPWFATMDHDRICQELEAWCFISPDLRTAAQRIDERVDAVVIAAELMLDPGRGVALWTNIRARRLPVFALRIDPGTDEQRFIVALRRVRMELDARLAADAADGPR